MIENRSVALKEVLKEVKSISQIHQYASAHQHLLYDIITDPDIFLLELSCLSLSKLLVYFCLSCLFS